MSQYAFACAATLYPDGSVYDKGEAGITVRDYLAAKAMQGLLSDGWCAEARELSPKTGWREVADDAYKMADAMLAARQQ